MLREKSTLLSLKLLKSASAKSLSENEKPIKESAPAVLKNS